MTRYEFKATTSKSDIIMGIIFPAMIMLPILAIQLASFYLKLNGVFKSYPVILLIIVGIFLGGGFLLIRKIQGGLVKKYVVEVFEKNIRIWGNGEEIMSGEVLSCNVNRKGGQVGAKSVSVDIYTDGGVIKFRAREKDYKKIIFSTAMNPLGTSELSDMEALLSLSKKLRN